MSTQRLVRLTCDNCGTYRTAGLTTAALARREAKRLGWTRARGRDLCPWCATIPVSEPAGQP